MYQVLLDGRLLFNANIEELKINNPIVTLEQNNISSFSFDIDKTHPKFKDIKVFKSIIEVRKKNGLLFYGRVIEQEENSYLTYTIYCESVFAYLCDSIQKKYDYQGSVRGLLEYFVNEHNSQVEKEKQFVVGNVDKFDANDLIVRADSNFPTTWKAIKDKLIDKLGGYLQFRLENGTKYIDYVLDLKYHNAQKIEFGSNLLEVKKIKDFTDIATIVKPLGAKDEQGNRLTIASVNNGKDYLEDLEAIKQFGRITKVVIYDNVHEAKNLLTKGQNDLLEAYKMTYSLSLKAIDLGTYPFNMIGKIGVISKPHNIDDYFVPMKMKINLFNPSDNKIDLNSTIKTLTQDNNDIVTGQGTIVEIIENIKGDYDVNLPQKLETLKNTLISLISQSESNITLRVEGVEQTVKDNISTTTSNSAQIEVTDTAISNITKEMKEIVNQITGLITKEEVEHMMRFENGFLIINSNDSKFSMKLSKTELGFYDGNNKVAWISNNELNISNAIVTNGIVVGDSVDRLTLQFEGKNGWSFM